LSKPLPVLEQEHGAKAPQTLLQHKSFTDAMWEWGHVGQRG